MTLDSLVSVHLDIRAYTGRLVVQQLRLWTSDQKGVSSKRWPNSYMLNDLCRVCTNREE